MAIDATVRAERAWRKILRKPITLVMTKPRTPSGGAVRLPAQTVRINSDNRASVIGGPAGMAPTRAVMVYGVVGHPTQPDNDIQEGYTFVLDGDAYRIVDIIPATPGEIQAQAAVVG